MKVFLRSFGCQMNKLDTNLVVNSFLQAGFEFTEEAGEADVVLVRYGHRLRNVLVEDAQRGRLN